RCSLERVAEICAGRITRGGDRDAVPEGFSRIRETTGGELRKEPAILKFIIQHDRVTGRVRAVWDGEARPQRTCVYRPRQQVASLIINGIDQVDHFHKIITADFTVGDRKSTRLNSSHVAISYAVFCLKKK